MVMYGCFLYLYQVTVVLAVPLQAQPAEELVISPGHQLVKYVEVPLSVVLMHHPRLLQQVAQDVAPHGSSLSAKLLFCKTKSGNILYIVFPACI